MQERTTQAHLMKVVESYKDNFTVHGMTKIFTGHPVESIVWFVLLLLCLVFVGRESYYFYKEYITFDIRTEMRMTTVEDMTLPTITVCSMGPVQMVRKGVQWKNESLVPDLKLNDSNISNSQSKPLIDFVRGPGAMYVLQHQNFPACIIINSGSRITSSTPLNESTISFLPQITILRLYVHSKDDISFSLRSNKPEAILEVGLHEIVFKNKRIFHRLEYPYPSDCVNESEKLNLFGGKYSVNKCKDSCAIMQQINQCNATLDQWKQHIASKKESIKSSSECNQRKCDMKIRKCLRDALLSPNHCSCRPSCYEEIVDTVKSKDFSRDGVFKLKFSADNIFTTITEVPAYPANKFVTDIGSWLGLFSGMSILSVVEITIFIVLSVITFVQRKP